MCRIVVVNERNSFVFKADITCGTCPIKTGFTCVGANCHGRVATPPDNAGHTLGAASKNSHLLKIFFKQLLTLVKINDKNHVKYHLKGKETKVYKTIKTGIFSDGLRKLRRT